MTGIPSKSWWESNPWKIIRAISIILTIIASFLTALQLLGTLDVYSLLILPIINFLTIPIPLYSIPLVLLIYIVVLALIALKIESNTKIMIDPLDLAGILDNAYVRHLAILCKTPRTVDFLTKEYPEIRKQFGITDGYSINELLKELENRDFFVFQNGKWKVTEIALFYIEKYHSINDISDLKKDIL